MKINEIFYSLQGEGARAGEPSIFIRVTGCDLACTFCDTEFVSGKEMTNDEILAYISKWPCKWIVWTGGEPTLQVTDEVVAFFEEHGYKQAIESNGNHPLPKGLDWTVISPKVAEHVVKRHNPNGCNELRYVRHLGQMAAPEPAIKADRYYISPQFKGDKPDAETIAHCTNLCLANPKWSLSIQSHKLLKIL